MSGRRRADSPASSLGQASVEVIAAIPALLVAGIIAFQLLAVGYASSLADGAAEAGALAVAAGTDPEQAARAALPGWARSRVDVAVEPGGRIAVELRPPAVLASLARALTVESSAWARPAR